MDLDIFEEEEEEEGVIEEVEEQGVIDEEDEQDENEDNNGQLAIIQRQRADTFIVLPGVRLNSIVIMDNLNYKYYKNGARNNKTYLVCENQKNVAAHCPSTAWVRTTDIPKGNGDIIVRVQHNHLPPKVDVPMVHLRRSIGLAGTSTGNLATSIRQIYNREVVLNPEGAKNYTHLQSRVCLNKMRRRRRPKNPTTIDHLADILNEPTTPTSYTSTLQRPSSRFFQHGYPLIVDRERVGVVFANTDAIEKCRGELLQSITIAGVDGTFKTVPRNPPDLQKGCLLTFHIVFRNVSFPMVYALTVRMTQSTYEAFFRVVRQILPLNYNQLTIITDYERGLMNAVRIVFPDIKLQGCWFHFCQSVIRYCKRSMNSLFHLFQTSVEAATVLRMVLALPHLPAEPQMNCSFTMFDGFRIIVDYVNQQPAIRERLQAFLFGYIQDFWLTQITAANISVFGSEVRTNNYVESFHATLKTQIGKHPNIWDFMRIFNLIIYSCL